jgi:hypothetical protein
MGQVRWRKPRFHTQVCHVPVQSACGTNTDFVLQLVGSRSRSWDWNRARFVSRFRHGRERLKQLGRQRGWKQQRRVQWRRWKQPCSSQHPPNPQITKFREHHETRHLRKDCDARNLYQNRNKREYVPCHFPRPLNPLLTFTSDVDEKCKPDGPLKRAFYFAVDLKLGLFAGLSLPLGLQIDTSWIQTGVPGMSGLQYVVNLWQHCWDISNTTLGRWESGQVEDEAWAGLTRSRFKLADAFYDHKNETQLTPEELHSFNKGHGSKMTSSKYSSGNSKTTKTTGGYNPWQDPSDRSQKVSFWHPSTPDLIYASTTEPWWNNERDELPTLAAGPPAAPMGTDAAEKSQTTAIAQNPKDPRAIKESPSSWTMVPITSTSMLDEKQTWTLEETTVLSGATPVTTMVTRTTEVIVNTVEFTPSPVL